MTNAGFATGWHNWTHSTKSQKLSFFERLDLNIVKDHRKQLKYPIHEVKDFSDSKFIGFDSVRL